MAKYNVVQKRKRAEKAVRKRAAHGEPTTGKLKQKSQLHSVSGKRQRKLFKKWRREQKQAVEKGLDVEMAATPESEGNSQYSNKTSTKFHIKKGFKLKNFKARGKKTKTTLKPAAAAAEDAMVE